MNINNEIKEIMNVLENIGNEKALQYVIWTKDKAKIKFEKELPQFKITNNYIYWCNLGVNIGSEQDKVRPVIIVKTQKESLNCTVLPLTTKRMNDTRWYHVDLENLNSTVLIEQLRNVSKLRIITPHRIKGKLSKITLKDWENIDLAMRKYYIMTKWK